MQKKGGELSLILDEIKNTSKVSYIPFTNTFRSYRGLNVTEKMVYLTLWSMAGEKSYAFPSVPTICGELGISKSTLLRTLKTLEEKKCIYVINQFDKETERQLSNLYYVVEWIANESRFNTSHFELLERLYPTKKRYLTTEEANKFRKTKKPPKTNDNLEWLLR